MKANTRSLVLCTILLTFLVWTEADIKRECREQSMVSWASLKKLNAGNFNLEDPRLKCYLRCFMMKNGILDENDRVDLGKALRHLPRRMRESSREIFHRCEPTGLQEDSCDKVFRIAQCYVKLQPQILKYVSFV
ncbi:hypothetical protein KPH14_004026 [Odynerus spinipes]|uniref:Uncharacterized protein n=1 Tax=Odynerus spinipes TaxID=1348599 RepID=A0AAD9RYI5_9HYME|nr:hypothetical protein KPH14_004026 [Odynerus spinipes]